VRKPRSKLRSLDRKKLGEIAYRKLRAKKTKQERRRKWLRHRGGQPWAKDRLRKRRWYTEHEKTRIPVRGPGGLRQLRELCIAFRSPLPVTPGYDGDPRQVWPPAFLLPSRAVYVCRCPWCKGITHPVPAPGRLPMSITSMAPVDPGLRARLDLASRDAILTLNKSRTIPWTTIKRTPQ